MLKRFASLPCSFGLFGLSVYLVEPDQPDRLVPRSSPAWVGVGTLWPGHFAIVMLGIPTRGTSVTVIWNKRYSNWKASRFQRAIGPEALTA